MPFKNPKDRNAYMRQRRANLRDAAGLSKRGRPRKPGQPIKYNTKLLVEILNAMLKPYTGLDAIAKRHGISVQAIYAWQKLSAQHEAEGKTDSPFLISYLDNVAFFHRHAAFVRAVAVSRIDARIIEAATSSHFEPLFNAQTGQPFWKVDAKVAADAKSMDDFDWDLDYGAPRPRRHLQAR